MTHQDQWTAGERAAFLQTVTWVPNVAMRLICERLDRAVQLLAADQGESASEAFVAVLSAQSVANMWSTQAALADQEQPGTSGASEPSPRSISLSGEVVAWRYRSDPSEDWQYEDHTERHTPYAVGRMRRSCFPEFQPLYTAPSSQGGEGGA